MSAKKGTLAQVLVDEFDFSGDTAQVTVTVAMTEQECTGLQAEAMAYEPILPSMRIEQNGYIRGAGSAGDFEDELWERFGVAGVIVAALIGTDVDACPAYVLADTFKQTMNIQHPATGLITLNGAWGIGEGGHRGIRVFYGTLDATGAEAAVDLGAAGSAGGRCFLFVQAITGTATDAIIDVESSATEGGTYAEEAEFTFSAVGAYMELMTGTVNRWVRLNVEDLGDADDFTVVLVVCVDGVTQ